MDAEAMDTEPDSELAANAMVKDVDDDDILYNIDIAFPTWLWQAMLILISVSVHHPSLFSLQDDNDLHSSIHSFVTLPPSLSAFLSSNIFLTQAHVNVPIRKQACLWSVIAVTIPGISLMAGSICC